VEVVALLMEVLLSFSVTDWTFGSFGVGINLSGKATDASSVSYGKNEAWGSPGNGNQH
jgi:hypothetical protein